MPTSPQPVDVLARAAELRAGGKSWEFTARELHFDDVRELRDLVGQNDRAFQRVLNRARRDVIDDSFGEGVFVLRRLMRSPDEAVAYKAADSMIRFKATTIRQGI